MISGEFVVEDVKVSFVLIDGFLQVSFNISKRDLFLKTDGEIYRRLLFFNNPKLIQSECRIKLGKHLIDFRDSLDVNSFSKDRSFTSWRFNIRKKIFQDQMTKRLLTTHSFHATTTLSWQDHLAFFQAMKKCLA